MRHLLLAVGLTLLPACARVAPATVERRPTWPEPPAPARVRWLASFPDERATAKPRSGFRRVLELILGEDPGTSRKPDRPLLARPFGLALAGERLLVADPDGRQVLSVAWRQGEHEPVTCDAPWVSPMAVAVGPDGSIYVADAGAGRVVRKSGSSCTSIGAGVLQRPTGLAFSEGRIWVVDPPAHRLISFSPDGRELSRFGGRGDAAGEFNYPTAVATGKGGSLVVVDALNFRVAALSPSGQPLATVGEPGEGGGGFGRPKAVAVDELGRLYVTDAQHGVVVVFDPNWVFEYAFGGGGAGAGSLALPAGVAASEGVVFVADSFHHRVQIYEVLGGEP
ncbi:MAG: NHL repeat-containing protein [Myxococcaceae bacterium]